MTARFLLGAGMILQLAHGVAQADWKAVGRGTAGFSTEVQTLWGDSQLDRLLAGGTFRFIANETDTVETCGVAAWNSVRWDSLARRIQVPGGDSINQQIGWFLRFQDDLYACGHFPLEYEPGLYTRGMARLVEQEQRWEELECISPPLSALTQLIHKNPDASSIYATGFADTLCSYPEACVFRYDGTAFHEWEPWGLIPPAPNNYVAYVFDFQGYTYMNGGYSNPNGTGVKYFMRYNGTTWEDVPGWNNAYHIRDVEVQDDVLYVCGTFKQSSGAPGNLVARFDGTTWDDLDGGIAYLDFPPAATAFRMEWHNGLLYVGGQFDNAAGTPLGFGLAIWDGNQWSGLPGAFTTPPPQANDFSRVYDLTFWRDSLYICGPFNSIDGEPIRQVAQYVGELPSMGINDHGPPSLLSIAPNPARDNFLLRELPKGAMRVQLRDGLGRLLLNEQAGPGPFDISSLPSGLYHIVVADRFGLPLARAPLVKH